MSNIFRVIGITGMPGSGKSELARIGKDFGYTIVIMGDVIRQKVREEGKEPTPENCNLMMQELRRRHGPNAVALATVAEIEKISKEGKNKFIIDGIRSQDEVDTFRKKFDDAFSVLAVHADSKFRFNRLKERKRSDAPTTIEEFNRRDQVELSVGLGEAIAYANYMIENNSNIEEFKKKVYDFFNHFEQVEK
ncbi:MAG: flagellar hook-basal body complex protein FliE [Candidatus Heimdallarchaeum aukensis]|uniref:Flagellar hook-basal body complex protein FliE n=1 Tax=Candidatus Heimdallarchaeum aukensis TaxID=2876573 RepID=A0A9Y1FLS5_9ARCH|nr:MAG: flagellar hook-basal body complex protein FliE [Candidatus Heimdallarchaeum aukensis]